MTTAAIRLDGVDMRFGSTRALKSIDLQLDRGHVVALMGPNGSGKATLLRALAGLGLGSQSTIAPVITDSEVDSVLAVDNHGHHA